MKDTFAPKAIDVGDIQHIIVRKTGGGLGGDWHLQEVEVWHPGKEHGGGDPRHNCRIQTWRVGRTPQGKKKQDVYVYGCVCFLKQPVAISHIA